ncbi:MAG TPA: chemotaxis protein CheA [Lacipirellula sp.]
MELADQDLIAEFVIESQEGLAHVEQQMLAIEARGADIDVDLVNAVFRTMHSIKGAAGFLGLDRIGVLAHSLEELLDDLRNRELIPTPQLVTAILRSADLMKGLIDAVESSNEADVSSHVAELQRYRPGIDVEPAQPQLPAAEAPVSAAGSPPSRVELSEAVREFLEECQENLDQMERDLVALEKEPTAENLLRSIFRTMHTIKGGAGFLALTRLEAVAHAAEELLGELRGGNRALTPEIATALLGSVDKCREGLRMVEATGSDVCLEQGPSLQHLLSEPSTPTPSAVTNPTPTTTTSGDATTGTRAITPASTDGSTTEKGAAAAGDSTIRVDVALLDKLMTRVGELVLARNQILQYTSRRDDAAFQSTAQRLNLITTELQEGVMKTRMQPIGNVWSKFPRVVRDLSSQLGKQVRIEMEGKETELDKTIVEAIKDPLTHLIRNAVDHGIEKPDVRQAAGKPTEGRLFLRAYHEGGQVNIEITDDGAGLNTDRIRKKAVERGLITADQASRMTDREAAQTILLPGFSTAEEVTSVSGRGVGMDVVKTNIEKIGGAIDLQSTAGQGTTVRIKIPLTLAIIPALVVTCGGDRYAIPQVSLLELVRLEGEQARKGIELVQGSPVYRLRGQLLPIVYLRHELELEPAPIEGASNLLNIVVLRADDRQFGLVVDSINDTEEIVVKPLGKQLKGIDVYAGSTIMGDGKVALILDVLGAAQRCHVVSQHRDRGVTNHALHVAARQGGRQTQLLLEVGDRRLAMPISLVSRLEEIPRAKVEWAGHREVVQYRGEIMPLVRLHKLLNIPSSGDDNLPLQVIVFQEGGQRYGFVVDRIADIADAEVAMTGACESDQVLVSAVVQERVTDLLNLPALMRRVSPADIECVAAV